MDCTETTYAVVLLYPDYFGDFGTTVHNGITSATSAAGAVEKIQRLAADAYPGFVDDPTDFLPLSVISGRDLALESPDD